MEGQNNNFDNNSAVRQETDLNKSFVKKVKSHVSGLLSTSLGKWFSGENNVQSNARHRVYDEDDDSYEIQPPSKRFKMPSPEVKSYMNSLSNNLSPISTENETNVRPNIFEPLPGPSGLQLQKDNSKSYMNSLSNNFSPISSRNETKVRPNIFEPSPGPSGLQLQKDKSPTAVLLNGDKDSVSSESDVSPLSLFRNSTETRINFNTPTSTSHNRSLFNNRPFTPQLNTSLSSKRPSFNACTFGSPNFVDRTLSTKQILSSPFYNGRTMYGGASAYSSSQGTAPKRLKSQIEVKPVNNSVGNDVSLSRTARRILNALEEFNPYPTDKLRPEGILSKYTGANPYLSHPYSRERKIPLALDKELQVPTVPDLLKMKLKERLQDSTVAVRQIATTSKSVLNRDDYRIRSKDDDTPKHTNKVKNKLTATRQKVDNQQVEEVKLPEIPLPITTLPKFDFSLPAPPSNAKQPLITVACIESPKAVNPTPVVKKLEATNAKDNETQFEFSNPLILADNLKSITAINDFKFSDPLFNQKEKNTPDINLNFKTSTPEAFTLKRKNPDLPLVNFQISKGSIEEIFNKRTRESLDQFKPAADLWECSVCLIRNAPEKLKCAACETAKPDLNSIKSTDVTKVTQSFGDQFKPPSSTWKCPTCLIRNKDEISKCACCETIKPGCKSTIPSGSGFGDVFKKKENEWECSVCMIRNKEDTTVCEACGTSKPGAKVDDGQIQKKTDVAVFNFGIFPKTKSETKTTGNETVQTSTVSLTSTTSIATSSTIPVFSFGIPETQTLTTTEKLVEPVLSVPKVDYSKLSLDKAAKESTKPVSSSSFTFGIPAKPSISTVVANPAQHETNPVQHERNPVQHETNPIQPQTSNPIVLSTSSSAFKFQSPTTTPSLKRSATDSKAAMVENKKLSSSITFQPPTVNSLPAPSPIHSIQSPDKPIFNIGKPAISQAPTTTSSFIFTPPPTKAPPAATTASTNLFSFAAKTTSQPLFGNTVTTTQSPVFKFSQAEHATPNQPAFAVTEKQSTLPLFGPPPSNSMFGSTKSAFEVPASTQPFGSVAPAVFGSEPKPSIAFATDSQKPKPQSVFGTESKPSIFGTEQKTFVSEQSAPVFGTDQKAAAPFGSTTEQKPSIFGSEQKAQSMFGTDQKALPAFGSTDAKPFTFGTAASSNETSPKPSLFSFGAKSSEPTKPFSFGPTPTQAAGSFNFNSSASPAFNFNAPKVDNTLPFQTAPNASNIFNAPPVQAPALQNGGFNFGTPTNADNSNKTGFNFGTTNQFAPAAPAPTSTAPASAGFWGIGSNANANPAPPVAGGFSFGQTPPPSQTPSFNANMKPNFNFTAGTMLTGFSATADSSQVPPRRRLKAVRRNPR